jgi:nicotinate-nucleotide adenylyltransferase
MPIGDGAAGRATRAGVEPKPSSIGEPLLDRPVADQPALDLPSLDLLSLDPPAMAGLRVGIFGGAFDPPHFGHLAAAQEVREALNLDRLLLIPAATSPFKAHDPAVGRGHPSGRPPGTPAHLRLRMMLAAVQEDPYLEVLPLEVNRGGISYTVDTLRALEAAGALELYLLMGADQWASFPMWKDPDEIVRRATVVVMTRQGAMGPEHAASGFAAPVRVDVPRMDLSSSLVRARVREGRSIRYWVPEPVRRIVEDTGLYLEEP